MAVTWNPLDKHVDIVLSNGDLTASRSMAITADRGVRATAQIPSGKWYWEVELVGSAYYTRINPGIGTAAADLGIETGMDIHGYGYRKTDGAKTWNGIAVPFGTSFGTGDTISVAMDADSGKLWFALNNIWQDSGNPAAGTGEAFSSISGSFFPLLSLADNGDACIAKFTAVDQSYPPPAGFEPIDTPVSIPGNNAVLRGPAPTPAGHFTTSYDNYNSSMYTLDFALLPGGTTQYTNYEFNSMVKFGDTFLGACSDGIYELEGDTDSGGPIGAYFETIVTDFGINNPKKVRFLFCGYEAEGDLIVTVGTKGAGHSSTLSSPVAGQQAKKVSGSRKIMGRYLSFQVSNVGGCDFGFDSMDVALVVMPRGMGGC